MTTPARCFLHSIWSNRGPRADERVFEWILQLALFQFWLVVVVKMLKSGHFGLKIRPLCFWNVTQNPWDYKTRAQELTSGAIRMWLSFFVKIWEHFKDGRVWGLFYRINLGVKFDNFYIFWFFSALDGQIWIKLVTKWKIFWCSNWFWQNFWSIWPSKFLGDYRSRC